MMGASHFLFRNEQGESATLLCAPIRPTGVNRLDVPVDDTTTGMRLESREFNDTEFAYPRIVRLFGQLRERAH
jgi:hypothetical protein